MSEKLNDITQKVQNSLGIPLNYSISSEALRMALEYEADRNWMIRKGERRGNMGLPLLEGDDADILSTNTIASLTRSLSAEIEDANRKRAAAQQILDKLKVVDMSVDDLVEADITNIDILFESFISDREGRIELEKTVELIQESEFFASATSVQEYRYALEGLSSQRIALADTVVRELQNQSLVPLEAVSIVLEVPVVGFGNQSCFIEQTGLELTKQEIGSDVLIILQVNRPYNQSSDNTLEQVQEWAELMRDRGRNVVVVDQNIYPECEGYTVKMGNLRSAAFDGFILVRGMENLNECMFVSTDEDNTNMPTNWLSSIAEKKSAAVLTPVAFGFEDRLDIYNAGEEIRRIIAGKRLETIDEFFNTPVTHTSLVEMFRLFFSGGDSGYLEPVVMSSMAIRGDMFKTTAGYPPIDEVIKMVRILFIQSLMQGEEIEVLKDLICTDNRRQIKAYLDTRTPSVAAWKNPTTPFKTDEVDEVRVMRSPLSDTDVVWNTASLDDYFAKVFRYLGITDRSTVEELLTHVHVYPEVINKITQFGNSFYFSYEK